MKAPKKSGAKSRKPKGEESYLAGIPVLLQKMDSKRTFECTLLNISLNDFTVRFEKNKFDFKKSENFFILIDPELFNITNKNVLKINAICNTVEVNKFTITAKFTELNESLLRDIEIIVKCFKNLNEYEF
ncbi:hypothetical protein [Fluviispira vulneris]|uniref:hypothetical protein n=1 Tax=Fluviispira vulneris TaxID=2763012 RepID=UPI001644E6CC|nr:hypothetical protein [Fluviispira vulneris]